MDGQNLRGEGIPYSGSNPLTLGTEDVTIAANTLLTQALTIKNGVEPGVSGIDFGIITIGSLTKKITIEHSLGVTPTAFYIIPCDDTLLTSYRVCAFLNGSEITANGSLGMHRYDNSTTSYSATEISYQNQQDYFESGDYYWIAIA